MDKQPYKKSTKPKKGLKRWQIVLISVVSVLLVLVLLAVGFYFSKLNKMDRVSPDDSQPIDTSMVIEVDPEDMNDLEAEGEYVPAELPEGDVFADKDLINILLLGTDERAANFSSNSRADSIMLLSLNKRTGAIKLVSFQRGTSVPIEGREDDWLTHTFAYGGADLTVKTVEQCFLIDIDGYIRVNFNTFEQLVNSVGGVDITLTAAEVGALNGLTYTNAQTKATVVEGVNHLDGYDALQYSRLRYVDSDWVRIVRQRNVIKAAVAQMKDLGLFELNAMLDDLLPLVQTNLTNGQITSLLFHATSFMDSEIEDMSLPAKGTYYGAAVGGGKVLNVTDFAANSKILHEFLADE